MDKQKPYERREAKRKASLWRPMSEGMDADTMVLLLIAPVEDESYVTAAYWSGSRWLCAHSATPINGRKSGWMHMHEAVDALVVKRGEVTHG